MTAAAGRYGYTLKVIVCVLLNRQAGLYARDAIEVAAYHFRGWQSMEFAGTAYDWEVLAVQPGWLRGWRYDEFTTSSA